VDTLVLLWAAWVATLVPLWVVWVVLLWEEWADTLALLWAAWVVLQWVDILAVPIPTTATETCLLDIKKKNNIHTIVSLIFSNHRFEETFKCSYLVNSHIKEKREKKNRRRHQSTMYVWALLGETGFRMQSFNFRVQHQQQQPRPV
jgi:hypothetical protein